MGASQNPPAASGTEVWPPSLIVVNAGNELQGVYSHHGKFNWAPV